jgi:hypothetical protein
VIFHLLEYDEMQADWQENFGILTSDNDMRRRADQLFTDGLARR